MTSCRFTAVPNWINRRTTAPTFFSVGSPTGFAVFSRGSRRHHLPDAHAEDRRRGERRRGRGKSWFFFRRPGLRDRESTGHTVTANLPTAQLGAWIFDSPLRLGLKEKLANVCGIFPKRRRINRCSRQPFVRWRKGNGRIVASSLACGRWENCRPSCPLVRVGNLALEPVPASRTISAGAATRGSEASMTPPKIALERIGGARGGPRPGAQRRDGLQRRHAHWKPAPGECPRCGSTGTRRAAGMRIHTKLRSAEEWHDLKLMTEVFSRLGRPCPVHQPTDQWKIL